jgi:hypothetical protein
MSRRTNGRYVGDCAETQVGALGAQCLHRAALRQVLVVDRGEHVGQADEARGVSTHAVPEQRVHIRFIEHRPVLDAIGEPPRHDARVIGELVGDIAIEPAAGILQRLRQIPMIKAEPRRDAARG